MGTFKDKSVLKLKITRYVFDAQRERIASRGGVCSISEATTGEEKAGQ